MGVKNAFFSWGWLRVRRLERPVISVGSLSAGGAGKTGPEGDNLCYEKRKAVCIWVDVNFQVTCTTIHEGIATSRTVRTVFVEVVNGVVGILEIKKGRKQS